MDSYYAVVNMLEINSPRCLTVIGYGDVTRSRKQSRTGSQKETDRGKKVKSVSGLGNQL